MADQRIRDLERALRCAPLGTDYESALEQLRHERVRLGRLPTCGHFALAPSVGLCWECRRPGEVMIGYLDPYTRGAHGRRGLLSRHIAAFHSGRVVPFCRNPETWWSRHGESLVHRWDSLVTCGPCFTRAYRLKLAAHHAPRPHIVDPEAFAGRQADEARAG